MEVSIIEIIRNIEKEIFENSNGKIVVNGVIASALEGSYNYMTYMNSTIKTSIYVEGSLSNDEKSVQVHIDPFLPPHDKNIYHYYTDSTETNKEIVHTIPEEIFEYLY